MGLTTHPSDGGRRGFTLVEMVVSLAVVSVLTVGMSSAVVLATRSLPHHANPAAATVQAAAAMHQLRDDLRSATQLLRREPHRVTINLPDRTGDGLPEVVTWQWSATPDEPLTRTVLGRDPVVVLDQTRDFNISYIRDKLEEDFPPPLTESDEVLLSSFDDEDSGDEYQVEQEKEIGFRFTPALPGAAESWTVTRVLLRSDEEGKDDGTAEVRLAAAAGKQPGATLATVEVDEKDVLKQGFKWAEVSFAGVPQLARGAGATVTVANAGKDEAGLIRWDPDGRPANVHYRDDTSKAYTTPTPEGAMNHFVYGTYISPGEPWRLTRRILRGVRVELVHADAPHLRQTMTVSLPNHPVAAETLLEANLAVSPYPLDLDADGAADWEVKDDLDPADFTAGGWLMQDEIKREDLGAALNRPFTLELWLQDITDDDGDGGEMELRFDNGGGMGAKLKLWLECSGGVQDLTLIYHNADHEDVTLVRESFAAGQTVAIKLVVDTDRDTLAVVLNGGQPTSYRYGPDHNLHDNLFKLKPDGGEDGLRLEHLRLVVAGVTSVPVDESGDAGGGGDDDDDESDGGDDESDGGDDEEDGDD